ncbi:MAG: hypothetical protein ACOYEN_03195 [Limnochordia bacterium]
MPKNRVVLAILCTLVVVIMAVSIALAQTPLRAECANRQAQCQGNRQQIQRHLHQGECDRAECPCEEPQRQCLRLRAR